MSKISFLEESLKNVQDIFMENSDTILDNFQLIGRELEDISNVLSTPKSTKVLPEFLEYLKNEEQLISEKKNIYNDKFNNIIVKYQNLKNEVQSMVGDSNG